MKSPVLFVNYWLFFMLVAWVPLSAAATGPSNGGAQATLIGTYWKLVELDGDEVKTEDGQREMKITLRSENRVNGFAGCNSFFGSYTTNSNTLIFSQLAASRKFCDGSMDREALFLKILAEVKEYKITGEILQLFDIEGRLRAVLNAVYLQ